MAKYTFQKSKIWEAGNPIDYSVKPITIKTQKGGVKGEKTARNKLGNPGLGRVWILINQEE